MTDLKIPAELVIGQAVKDLVFNTEGPDSEEEAVELLGQTVLKKLDHYGYKIIKKRKPKVVLPKNEDALKEIQKLGQEFEKDEYLEGIMNRDKKENTE
jgi:hypothetical protein